MVLKILYLVQIVDKQQSKCYIKRQNNFTYGQLKKFFSNFEISYKISILILHFQVNKKVFFHIFFHLDNQKDRIFMQKNCTKWQKLCNEKDCQKSQQSLNN
jgi:hypothetical protein